MAMGDFPPFFAAVPPAQDSREKKACIYHPYVLFHNTMKIRSKIGGGGGRDGGTPAAERSRETMTRHNWAASKLIKVKLADQSDAPSPSQAGGARQSAAIAPQESAILPQPDCNSSLGIAPDCTRLHQIAPNCGQLRIKHPRAIQKTLDNGKIAKYPLAIVP
jgi:hypothetical protein